MGRGLLGNVAYEFLLAFPAVSFISCSSNFDGLRDGWLNYGIRTIYVIKLIIKFLYSLINFFVKSLKAKEKMFYETRQK